MKQNHILKFFIVVVLLLPVMLYSQEQPAEQQIQDERIFVVTKNDGTHFVGRIISQDPREVLIETANGQIYIPRHEIRQIREALQGEVSSKGIFMPAEVFSTRYFITTNGLTVKKKETYMLFSLLGPDFQFGVADNLGLGVMTSWFGSPIIATGKLSLPINEKFSTGVGFLAGTGGWAFSGFRLFLPFFVVTAGDRIKNLNVSMGYGKISIPEEWVFGFNSAGNFLISVAGMAKIGAKTSLVFDTFIIPRSGTYQTTEWYSYMDSNGDYREGTRPVSRKRYTIAFILPGLRFQTTPHSAFQFGFSGGLAEGQPFIIPIPMIQWFRML
jgi:hypothetical protein